MKKIISSFLIVVISIITLGCSSKEKEVIEASMIYPDGLPAIAMSKFLDSNSIENLTIKAEKQNTTDALLAELIKGNSDFAIVPSNLALKAAEKNLPYKIAGTIGWGSLYLISFEDGINLENIKDYEIYNTGKGLTPDIITKNILNEKGFKDDELKFNYVSAASELAPLIISGKAKVAVVPEPILSTIKNKGIKANTILDLNKEWSSKYNVEAGYPQSTLLIKSEIFDKFKSDGRLDTLLSTIQNDVKWVNENSSEVGSICDNLGITVNKEILPAAIANGNLNFIDYSKCKAEYDIYFKAIGGDSNIYNKLFE